MKSDQCPVCGSSQFYVKDPDDEYEIYEFELKNGRITMIPSTDSTDMPAIKNQTETYCNKCAWHDRFQVLKP